ncbi:MAG: PHB depolymerase family esterase [Bacteroidetes bacterium]|nr:PHB depolymerase family esterase [Bacteroidota bacterium]
MTALKFSYVFFLCFVLRVTNAQTGWNAVTSFGSNPGNLNMYSYVPAGITSKAPLVVVMHGCTQTASVVAVQSGWNTMADRHHFCVVYPEQNAANNSNNCFNWFVSGDINRNQGEASSIKQMVDYMKGHYLIDSTQIFVTGLSAGACMTNVMMACYPDVFKAGAPMSGAPYRAGAAALYGYTTTITPQQWGDSVRAAYPTYAGAYPKVVVFQGSADPVVNPQNEIEIMKQWTNVQGASQTPTTSTTTFNGGIYVMQNTYNNSISEVVETYTLMGLGHALALDTGTCYQQCGQIGTYAYNVYFSSTFWAAYFFGILNNNTLTINGLTNVVTNQTNVTYSVSATTGTTYTWSVPSGATIVSGQGTNSIVVNFGNTSGNVVITENIPPCKNGPYALWVNVGTTGIENATSAENSFSLYPNPASSILQINTLDNMQGEIKIYDVLGNDVLKEPFFIKGKEVVAIPIHNLSNGLYFIKIQNTVKKWIKQ